MKKTPIGYLPLCEALLNEGVSVAMIKKHRFCLQALAAGMYADPIDIDHDQVGFRFAIESKGRHGQRRAECEFSALSSSAFVSLAYNQKGEQRFVTRIPKSRLSLTTAPVTMIWLFPVESDFNWWELLQIWVEQKILALKAKCGTRVG